MSKVRGQFSGLDGHIVVAQSLASCSVQASVATASVDTGTPMRDDDLRSASFLDSTGFPSIAFASTEVTGDDTAITLVGVFTEANSTRAVISGRRTYELADRWQGDHHDGVPVFVLTHDVPDDPPPGSVRYVTDVRECASQARAAAGDGDVMVHGAGAAQALLRAGQLDELELHVVPVLPGQGRRLFDNLPAEPIELDLIRRLTTPDVEELAQRVTHLRYRVRRSGTPDSPGLTAHPAVGTGQASTVGGPHST